MKRLLKWVWQLPQHIVAMLYYIYLHLNKQIIMVEKEDSYIVYTKGTLGCITFGKYIFVSYISKNKGIKHEVGHTIQSLLLGPLYLIIVCIPLLFWTCCHKWIFPNKPYNWLWCEKWADKLGGV